MADLFEIHIYSDGNYTGKMSVEDFRRAAKVPRTMFLPEAIEKFNDWKASIGEPERAELSSGGGSRRTATKRKRSYTKRAKSGHAKKRRTLTRLRATKRGRGYGVMRAGRVSSYARKETAAAARKDLEAMYDRVAQQNSYVVGPYTEYGPAHEKAMRVESAGGRGLRIDKRRGGWYVSYVSSKLLH